MNETYQTQLARKIDTGEYTTYDAMEIIMWLNQRKRGYK